MNNSLRPPIYIGLLAATIVLGLAIRWPGLPVPGWLTKPAGDMLYATAVYWGWRLVLPRRHSGWAFFATCLSCTVIEFLKLSHVPWLLALRASPGGRLVFGVGFHWGNLLCYLGGAILAVTCERLIAASSSPARSADADGSAPR